MKNWKKFAAVTAVSLSLGFGGIQAVCPKPAYALASEVSTQRDIKYHSKFIERYKSLSLDGLVSEDFERNGLLKMGNEDMYAVTTRFRAFNKGHFCLDYIKMDYFEHGKLDEDKSFRIIQMGNFYINDDYAVFKEDPVTSDAYYSIDGSLRSIKIWTYKLKPDAPKDPEADKWVTEDSIAFKKSSDGQFYVEYYGSEEDKLVVDKELIKQLEELFDLASKNYETVESLIKEK